MNLLYTVESEQGNLVFENAWVLIDRGPRRDLVIKNER